MVEIQVQFVNGEWRVISHVMNDPTYVLKAMKAAAQQFPDKRVRAVHNGRLIDML